MSSRNQAPDDSGKEPEGSSPGENSEASIQPAEQQDSNPAGESGQDQESTVDADQEIGKMKDKITKLQKENEELNEKYLRKLADEVNFRKRLARDKEDAQKYAVSLLLSDLVLIMDDLDRAIFSAENAKDYTLVHDGVLMIRKQLGQILETKYGLKKIESLGAPFNPETHEAVMVVEGAADSEATVAQEFLPAYMLHERVLRTAKVKVSMPRQNTSDSESGNAGPDDKGDPATASE